MLSKPILVFGCGNTLFGDDGFGPEVISYLRANHELPESVVAEDVGTSIRELLFDLLIAGPAKRTILIIDATEQEGLTPGQLTELTPTSMAACKSNDFSVHQFPSLNMLEELASLEGVEVAMLAVRVKEIPGQVAPGLSEEVAGAIPLACTWIMEHIDAATSSQSRSGKGQEAAVEQGDFIHNINPGLEPVAEFIRRRVS